MILSFNELNEKKLINYKKYPILELEGDKDENGYQIFTPRFIVDSMINDIGIKKITDINKTILEPTSGDGAFTVRILDLRLKNIIKENIDNFLLKSLIATSTIYSIEMDQNLLIKQRNNIYTLINYYLSKHSIEINNKYLNTLEKIIKNNFIWGETNIRKDEFFRDNNEAVIGWYMPTEVEKIEKTKVNKVVEIVNLFGEVEYREINTNNKIEKKTIKSNRTIKNRIKIYEWKIKENFDFEMVHVPVEVD